MIQRTAATSGLHGLTLTRDRAAGEPRTPFRAALDGAESAASRRARESAEDLVAVSLVEPTLKLLRESNGAAAPFAPGEAEKAFGPLLDQAVAQRLVRASNFGIVDRVASDLLRNAQARAALAPGVDSHG